MKTYKVTTNHSVYIDDYNEGELDYVNGYNVDAIIKAENVQEAINKYYTNILGFTFDFQHAEVMNEDEESQDILHYSNLVDDDNSEASAGDILQWKSGNKKLYANDTQCTVELLTPCKIK